ncbi:hypothetical protein KM043_013855 [Ampulex compressa]|nr:hypothetical protein KM043_013855 [Ampulex compressa]
MATSPTVVKRPEQSWYYFGHETLRYYVATLIRLTRGAQRMVTRRKDLKSSQFLNGIRDTTFPTRCDIVVIGGGAIGSSIAYWLKQKVFKDLSVVVVERDPSYTKASTTLSVGGLRQQFSLEENIHMSLFGAEFIRNVNKHLDVPGEPPIDLSFHPYGYLTLGTEKHSEIIIKNSKLQNLLGAKNKILNKRNLERRFPWLNTDGIEVGCLGLEKEGWLDPWSLLCAFKKKAVYLGAQYITAEAKDFVFKQMDEYPNPFTESGVYEKPHKLTVQTLDGELRNIKFAVAVIAAGAFSANVAKMIRIGTGKGPLSVPLPVEPRKRYVYCFHCPDGPGLNTPLTIDPSGVYFRRDGLGGSYIGGKSPEEHEEPVVDNLDVDHDYFDNRVWPALANRIKAFQRLKVKSSWAGYYEYNTFDRNGIVGDHPYYNNIYIATGFSGHGIQQSPAVGRAIAECILDGNYMTIDLSRLNFNRVITKESIQETNII